MTSQTRPLCTGLTLLELMVAIAILAILVAIAVPNLQQVINNNRVAAQSNELLSLLHLARNQAVRLNANVELRLAPENVGWTGRVWVEECQDLEESEICEPADGCPPDEGFIRCLLASGLNLNGGSFSQTLTFNNRGYLDVGGDDWEANAATLCLRHPQCTGSAQHRRITILPTGQIEAEPIACGVACER